MTLQTMPLKILKSVQFPLVAAFAGCVMLSSMPAWAEVLTAGKIYSGGTRVQIPNAGISLKIPAGWRGGLTGAQGMFAIEKPQSAGFARVFVNAAKASPEQVRAMMTQTVPLDSVRLTPISAPRKQGKLLHVTYQVSGAPRPMQGAGAARSLSNGTAVTFVRLTDPVMTKPARQAIASIAGSLKVIKQKKSPAGSGWQQALAGWTVHKFFSGGGYGEQNSLRLCSNGQFVHTTKGTSVSPNGTGALGARRTGRWQAKGNFPQPGQLILQTADGAEALQLQYSNDKLYLDGQRWLRDSESPC